MDIVVKIIHFSNIYNTVSKQAVKKNSTSV